jgi:uracil-DNA glycosylase family 4
MHETLSGEEPENMCANPGEDPARLMEEVAGEILECRLCDLHRSRTHAVPGEGPVPARILLIGEAPGRREDERGRPFVGRAGSILSDLLKGIGVRREDVFITSIVKCRPPGNRNPKQHEIDTCLPYLERQIDLVSPDWIVPMGMFATSCVFRLFRIPFRSFRSVRATTRSVEHRGKKITIMPVYHPAVITHNPSTKEELHREFRVLGERLAELER